MSAHKDEKVVKVAIEPCHHVLIVLVRNLVVNGPVVALLAKDSELAVVVFLFAIGARTAETCTPSWQPTYFTESWD